MNSAMKLVLLALSAALVIGTSAFAADHSKDMNGPCKEDRAKFCAGQKWGKGLGKCLKGHEAELSAGCKAKLAEKKEDRNDRKEVHEEEAEARSEKSSQE